MHVTVTDALGHPLPNATVGVHMQKHEFGFGSAVQADRLASNDPAQDMYKQKVQQLFNITTIENHLKWQPWVGEWGSNFTQAQATAAVDWLNSRGIAVRGHNMVWPGKDNLAAVGQQHSQCRATQRGAAATASRHDRRPYSRRRQLASPAN